jgi:phosphohistidine phosphatase
MADQKVYFMQHGLAVDKADDPERPLSEAGIQQTQKIAETLRASGIIINRVFHSGKLRAIETADIMETVMDLDPATMIEGLSPNDEVTLLSQKLDISDVLYVGHLPHLENLITYLINGNVDHSIIKFQNSAVVCLEKSDNDYQLQWYLIPLLIKGQFQ